MEKRLRELRESLNAGQRESVHILYSIKLDLDEKTRATILNGISSMLNEIESMKLEYGLEAEEESLRRRANGAFTEIWVTINDLRPKSLQNYGSLTHEDKERLGPEVEKLLRLLGDLFSSLGHEVD